MKTAKKKYCSKKSPLGDLGVKQHQTRTAHEVPFRGFRGKMTFRGCAK
jgi:hypothetical protein